MHASSSVAILAAFIGCGGDQSGNPQTTEGATELLPDDDDPSETEAEPDPTEGPSVMACYPGASSDGATCIDTFRLPDDAEGYDYASPYQGSVQYTAPVRFLDLLEVDGAEMLAPNFRLDEFATPSRSRYAVVQPHAVKSLQKIRNAVGAIGVNSGYRSPGYNETIPGSATYSRHLYGDGFDLDPASVTLQALADECERKGAGYIEVYVSHVHCDWRDDPLEPAFFDALRGIAFTSTPWRDAAIAWRGAVLSAPAEGFDEGEPLREWAAHGADGSVLRAATGATFEAPEDAVEVTVTVGRVVDRRIALR